MPDVPIIAIFADHAGQAAYLADLARMAGFCATAGEDEAGQFSLRMEEGDLVLVRADGSRRFLKTPLRGGAVIDILQKAMLETQSLLGSFPLGDGVLDVRDSLWMREGESPLRLTEKEVAILVTLKNADGKAVSRQRLLDEVWAYAQGVETHTLETHIYRLRQKIERDPAVPKIVITQEDGYIIGQ